MLCGLNAIRLTSYPSPRHPQFAGCGDMDILRGDSFSKDFAIPKHFEEIRHKDEFLVFRQSCDWVE